MLLLGLSSEPQSCVRKDGAALQALFRLRICVPMPDHVTRQVPTPDDSCTLNPKPQALFRVRICITMPDHMTRQVHPPDDSCTLTLNPKLRSGSASASPS